VVVRRGLNDRLSSRTTVTQSGQATVKNTRFGLLFYKERVTDVRSPRCKGGRVLVRGSADGAQRRRSESHERTDGEHAPQAHIHWHPHELIQVLVSTINDSRAKWSPIVALSPPRHARTFVKSTRSRRARWLLMGSRSR
jgi:hypothetical protein